MPQVINGIGTWYWGKRNIHAIQSQCQHCGHIGELLSYDTRAYFVVLFIPIIPLRRMSRMRFFVRVIMGLVLMFMFHIISILQMARHTSSGV